MRILVLIYFLSFGIISCQNSKNVDFIEFTPEDKLFTICLPTQPVYETRKLPSQLGELTNSKYSLEYKNPTDGVLLYELSFTEYPSKSLDSLNLSHIEFDKAIKNVLDNVNGKLISDSLITTDGLQYREWAYTITSPSENTHIRRIYIYKNRIYRLHVLFSQEYEDTKLNKKVYTFLNSFKILR